jgi:hypothetical protein
MTTLSRTTTCPELGEWRAWLDHEYDTPELASHLDQCGACQRTVQQLRDDASIASEALRGLKPLRLPSAADVAMARERLAWRQQQADTATNPSGNNTRRVLLPRISTPWRVAASGIAAAMALTLLVSFTPEGRTAAAAFLAQFRSQQVAPVEVSAQSQTEIMRTLNTLGNLGTIQMGPRSAARSVNTLPTRPAEPRQVSLAEATQAVGFPLQTPDLTALPAGLDRTPRVNVIPANEFRFTFDKNKAQTYLRSKGQTNVNLPDKFNGATLVVSMPSAALLEYGGNSSRQALIVGQSGEIVVDVEGGVTLDEMRDFLLDLPGLPKDTTDQLRLIRNWNQTLPIPIPVDKVNWQAATFKGAQGLLLNDNTGVGSAAIWQSGGHLYGVAGSLKANDLKRVADSLAVR